MAISERFGRRFDDCLAAQLSTGSSQAQRGAASQFHPTLTVSREAGARATPVCELLADYLTSEDESAEFGWTVIDKELLARSMKSPWLSALDAVDTEAQADAPPARVIRRLAQLGSTIIIGLCGLYLTADLKNVFHIRLIGTEKSRLAYIQRSQHLDRLSASAYLQATDRERKDTAMSRFHRDIGDPVAYDTLLKTDGVRDEVLAQMIGDLFMDWAAEKAATWGKLVPISS